MSDKAKELFKIRNQLDKVSKEMDDFIKSLIRDAIVDEETNG